MNNSLTSFNQNIHETLFVNSVYAPNALATSE